MIKDINIVYVENFTDIRIETLLEYANKSSLELYSDILATVNLNKKAVAMPIGLIEEDMEEDTSALRPARRNRGIIY